MASNSTRPSCTWVTCIPPPFYLNRLIVTFFLYSLTRSEADLRPELPQLPPVLLREGHLAGLRQEGDGQQRQPGTVGAAARPPEGAGKQLLVLPGPDRQRCAATAAARQQLGRRGRQL